MERRKPPQKAPALFKVLALKRVGSGPIKWYEVTEWIGRSDAVLVVAAEWKAGNIARCIRPKMAVAA